MNEPDNETLPADDWAWDFFESYAGEENPWNIRAAARAANRDPKTISERRKNDPVFAELWAQADWIVRDMILAPLIKEAIHGIDRTYNRKDGTLVEKRFSDNKLRQWLLERIDPATFHLATKLQLERKNSDELPASFTFQMGDKPLEIEGSAVEEPDE